MFEKMHPKSILFFKRVVISRKLKLLFFSFLEPDKHGMIKIGDKEFCGIWLPGIAVQKIKSSLSL
jgi:hypothetical protein